MSDPEDRVLERLGGAEAITGPWHRIENTDDIRAY
jgi:hypothetical protein